MITETPSDSPLRGWSADKPEKHHQDATTEALYMVRGILSALRCAVSPDTGSITMVSTGEVHGAVEAALFIAELAQDQVDQWYKER